LWCKLRIADYSLRSILPKPAFADDSFRGEHLANREAPDFQLGPNALTRIYATSSSGKEVPLSAFAKMTSTIAPVAVNHQGQFPSVTLSFNLPPNVSIGAAVAGASQRQPDRMGSLDPIRHKSYPKNRAKDPSFRGMLCFNRGDRTFLIRKGSPLRMVRLSAQVCERGPKMGDLQCRAFASTGFLH
jgi:hypothetical protein